MRSLVVGLMIMMVAGCTSDQVVPCTGDGPFGRTCSEFRTQDGEPIGTVEYRYSNNGNTLVTDYVTPSGSIARTVSFNLKGEQVLNEREIIEGQEKVIAYSYNDIDSVSSIAYFTDQEIDSIAYCEFAGARRVKVRVQDGDEILRWEDYRYDSEGYLNRISYFGGDSTLIRYRQFEFFSNGKMKVIERTAQHVALHTDNIELDILNRPLKSIRRSAGGDTLFSVHFAYGQLGKLVEKTEATPDPTSSIQYYYYE